MVGRGEELNSAGQKVEGGRRFSGGGEIQLGRAARREAEFWQGRRREMGRLWEEWLAWTMVETMGVREEGEHSHGRKRGGVGEGAGEKNSERGRERAGTGAGGVA